MAVKNGSLATSLGKVGTSRQSHTRTCAALSEPATVPATTADSGGLAGPSAKILAIVGDGSRSSFDGTPWFEVMEHMADRLAWIEPGLKMTVISAAELASTAGGSSGGPPGLGDQISAVDVVFAVEVRQAEAIAALSGALGDVRTFACFDSAPELSALTRFGGTAIGSIAAGNPSTFDSLKASLPWNRECACAGVLRTTVEAWNRRRADDVLYALLVLVDAYVAEVPMLKNLRAGGPESLQCMIKNCGPQVLACFMDSNCREALSCLGKCAPTDQVCSYRCIVSYESPLLEAFSLCVLQKNNCLGLSADIRMTPQVLPMPTFRGAPLTFETADEIFCGWLKNAPRGGSASEDARYAQYDWSWRVTAGQNAAYDQFPCQYQLFYHGKRGASFWYDPVFQVRKFDGEVVWRRRHYRVSRASEPGTFFFSVLDNGVVSREFWRIVDCTDDLSWALFYYSGAAANVGQAYTGAVFCTPDGIWPSEEHQPRILRALDSCGIKLWELYRVDNSCCVGAPIGDHFEADD